ncbi:MAG: aa3-type cytochrome oxidase subunit IV [Pseudonocardiaceae bacterium]
MRSSARIFLVLGVLGLLAAIVFLIIAREPPGSAMLLVFALSMLYIAWQLGRGANTDAADDAEGVAQVGRDHVFPPSPWPVVMAVAVLVGVIGVRFAPIVAAIGGALLVASGAGWFLQRVHVGAAADRTAAGGPVGHPTTPRAGVNQGEDGGAL